MFDNISIIERKSKELKYRCVAWGLVNLTSQIVRFCSFSVESTNDHLGSFINVENTTQLVNPVGYLFSNSFSPCFDVQ